jgi:hypothetical protein
MANKSFVVQYLIKAREQYSAVAEKVRRSSKSMRDSIAQTRRAFVENSAKMRTAGAAMSLAVTTPLAFMANSLKNAARDAEETRSKFATVFRDTGGQAEAMADTLAKSFGLSGTKARELIGDTGDILTGFGFSQKAALALSTDMNELAVDLASFTNFAGGAEGASKALTKALLGEAESVKALGIVIRQDTPAYKGLVKHLQRTKGVSLIQAKALAALQIATEQSKNAVGDFARTQAQLANQERITSSAIQDLKESFGRILLPIMLTVTKAVRGMAAWLTNLSPAAKKTILILAAVVAVLGPLLLALGSITLLLPVIAAGLAGIGTAVAIATGPVGAFIAALALGALVIINNWSKVRAFFAEFSNEIQLVADIIAGVWDLLIRGLSGIGKIIGQTIGAIATLNFGSFDVKAILDAFSGTTAPPLVPSRVDVGVNVGLDPGLQQTGAATVTGTGARRPDVGMAG